MDKVYIYAIIENIIIFALCGFLVYTFIGNDIGWWWGLIPLVFINTFSGSSKKGDSNEGNL
tara:strand:+ start:306 stop:488 length:183 start_codon:yes stop_codon:yes gene_type:complete